MFFTLGVVDDFGAAVLVKSLVRLAFYQEVRSGYGRGAGKSELLLILSLEGFGKHPSVLCLQAEAGGVVSLSFPWSPSQYFVLSNGYFNQIGFTLFRFQKVVCTTKHKKEQ